MGRVDGVEDVAHRPLFPRSRDRCGAAVCLPDDPLGRALRERWRDSSGGALDQQGVSPSPRLRRALRHRRDPLAAQVNPINYGFQAVSQSQWRDYGDIDGFPPVFATGKDVLAFFSLAQRSFEANLYRLLAVGLCLRAAVFVAVALTAGRRGLLEVVTEAQATENPLVS